ncbi:uncharacterized protein LOC114309263 [Camellia sinensis]|uniref:uncharacterized protein LOC114309263 n=1 Tax=Camellia sinensis TaxID=4442 RepID=UPI001035EDB6|nr:uncharacterized protein LOC114309263 [Camellia sinensis]
MASMRRHFRLQNKNIFLTYPRCSLHKEGLLQKLRALFTNRQPNYIKGAHELHANGEPHPHALVQFAYHFQTQDERFFDVTYDNSNHHFHPNMQGAANHENVSEYISKQGDYTEWGEFYERGCCANQQNKENIYHEALAADNKKQALAMVRNGDPKCYWLNYDKLSSNYDRISFIPPLSYVHQFAEIIWAIPADLQQWVAENIKDEAQRPHRPKRIIIEGPSGIGKTCWIKFFKVS